MKALRQAISFLTVLPAGRQGAVMEMAPARAYFPLVGLLLGGVLAGADLALRPILPPLVSGAVLVVVLVVLTRALHVEGFMDACDGLLGGFTRERRLEIMKDSHVGGFAVIGVVGLLLLKWTAVVGLQPSVRLSTLVLFPCLSRWAMLVAMAGYPYARAQGVGASFQRGQNAWQVAFAFATALAASLLLARGAGVLLLVLATAMAWGLGRWMAGLLGGLTGDTYGAVNEVCEATVLVAAIALAAGAPVLFRWPMA